MDVIYTIFPTFINIIMVCFFSPLIIVKQIEFYE